METKINFNFYSYTKRDLINFIYGKNAQVDASIPIDFIKPIQELSGNTNGHTFYAMDYTGDNHIFGKLVNLKEEFFNKIARDAII